MAPMENPFLLLLWLGSKVETHVKSRKGNLTIIFAAKICEKTYKCNKRVVRLDLIQGLSAIPTQEKKIQQRKGSHCRNSPQGTKEAEGAADGMLIIAMQPQKQQIKAVSANQMEMQRLQSDLRRTMFQQKE